MSDEASQTPAEARRHDPRCATAKTATCRCACGGWRHNPATRAEAIARVRARRRAQEERALWDPNESPWLYDVTLWRRPSGEPMCSIPRSVIHAAPQGIEWGAEDGRTADLALNILNAFVPPIGVPRSPRTRRWLRARLLADALSAEPALQYPGTPVFCYRGVASRFAVVHHDAFMRDFLVRMPREGGIIAATDIRAWIKARLSPNVLPIRRATAKAEGCGA